MMKKFLFNIILLLIIIIPNHTKALSYAEASEILETFGDEIIVSSVDPDLFKEDVSDDDLFYFYTNILKCYFEKQNYNLDDVSVISFDSSDKATIGVSYTLDGGFFQLQKQVNIKYLDNYDEETFNTALEVLKQLDNSYVLQGMNSINSIYHYGEISNDDYETSTILARFSKMKEIIEKYPDFSFEIILGRGGGTPFGESRYATICLYKNNILYAYKEVTLDFEKVIYVSKSEDGTIYEKATNKLNKYFNNAVDIKFDISSADVFLEDIVSSYVSKYVPLDDVYNCVGVELNISDKVIYVTIIEVSDDFVDKAYTKSVDISNGVNVYTESYDVPLDSSIVADDVLKEDYVISFMDNNNIKLTYAFDINLIAAYNQNKITKITNGIDVYIPVENYKKGDKVNVYHINNDSSLGEMLTGEIVKIDNNLFLKFTTNHFSTYAIKEMDNKILLNNNPNTSDNINIYVGTFIISLLTIISILNKKETY